MVAISASSALSMLISNRSSILNIASDIDLFRGWASAVCHGRLGQEVERKYAATIIFKRANNLLQNRKGDGYN